MSAGWVAVGVRARAMTSRRLGSAGATRLGEAGSWEDAVELLAASTYGHDVRAGQTLAEAQHAVVDTMVWNLRVLAGWSPREGVAILRAMVAPVEVANTLDHLESLAGRRPRAPHRLAGLGTAWQRVQGATTPAEVRQELATSAWGDPGSDDLRAVGVTMEAVAADRLVSVVPEATPWAAGSVALLLARELEAGQGPLPEPCRVAAARVVGWAAVRAGSVQELVGALPRTASWALTGVSGPHDLWRAEARWWRRVDRDAGAMVRRSPPGHEVLVGAVALLSVDAWRVRAALELAALGGNGGSAQGSARESARGSGVGSDLRSALGSALGPGEDAHEVA